MTRILHRLHADVGNSCVRSFPGEIPERTALQSHPFLGGVAGAEGPVVGPLTARGIEEMKGMTEFGIILRLVGTAAFAYDSIR